MPILCVVKIQLQISYKNSYHLQNKTRQFLERRVFVGGKERLEPLAPGL